MKTTIQSKLNELAQIKYLSRWIIFAADLSISVAVSLFTILFLRYAINLSVDMAMILRMGLFSALASASAFLIFQSYKGVIRHSTIKELWRLGAATLFKASLLLIFVSLWGSPKPIKFWGMVFFYRCIHYSNPVGNLSCTSHKPL